MTNKRKVIGSYAISNNMAISIYEIDNYEDIILAGYNDKEPEWYNIAEDCSGFYMDALFIPFSEVMRV